jgi:cysteine desulfurase
MIDIKSFLFNLDILNIFASGGSACASGINKNSHVLSALKKKSGIRFSFSKYNTKKEINYATKNIIKLYRKKKYLIIIK